MSSMCVWFCGQKLSSDELSPESKMHAVPSCYSCEEPTTRARVAGPQAEAGRQHAAFCVPPSILTSVVFTIDWYMHRKKRTQARTGGTQKQWPPLICHLCTFTLPHLFTVTSYWSSNSPPQHSTGLRGSDCCSSFQRRYVGKGFFIHTKKAVQGNQPCTKLRVHLER
jgi:hypothetical protein